MRARLSSYFQAWSGIQQRTRSMLEAARSVGMHRRLMFRRIIAPQVLRYLGSARSEHREFLRLFVGPGDDSADLVQLVVHAQEVRRQRKRMAFRLTEPEQRTRLLLVDAVTVNGGAANANGIYYINCNGQTLVIDGGQVLPESLTALQEMGRLDDTLFFEPGTAAEFLRVPVRGLTDEDLDRMRERARPRAVDPGGADPDQVGDDPAHLAGDHPEHLAALRAIPTLVVLRPAGGDVRAGPPVAQPAVQRLEEPLPRAVGGAAQRMAHVDVRRGDRSLVLQQEGEVGPQRR
mgnify:CR=1 FL=1